MKTSVLAATVGLGVGTVALAWYTYRAVRARNRRRQPPDPAKWQHIGVLRELILSPVKSCAAVQLDAADCDEFGLISRGFRNRSLLLLNDDDQLGFAGAYPLMLGIKSELIGSQLIRLTAPNAAPLTLDLTALIAVGAVMEKPLRGYRMRLVRCSAEHDTWFSRAILQRDSGMRLFVNVATVVATSWWRRIPSDFMPVMVMHSKSVEDLNSRLSPKNQAHHQQFRPNMLIESEAHVQAFDEDNWLWLRIGEDTILHFSAPCLRCILPNVDINTCKRNADFEPLRTLKKYRLRSHPVEPEMGAYFNVYQAGLVNTGDPVYVQYKTHDK